MLNTHPQTRTVKKHLTPDSTPDTTPILESRARLRVPKANIIKAWVQEGGMQGGDQPNFIPRYGRPERFSCSPMTRAIGGTITKGYRKIREGEEPYSGAAVSPPHLGRQARGNH